MKVYEVFTLQPVSSVPFGPVCTLSQPYPLEGTCLIPGQTLSSFGNPISSVRFPLSR